MPGLYFAQELAVCGLRFCLQILDVMDNLMWVTIVFLSYFLFPSQIRTTLGDKFRD